MKVIYLFLCETTLCSTSEMFGLNGLLLWLKIKNSTNKEADRFQKIDDELTCKVMDKLTTRQP
jgi:hypothetical protein